MKRVLLTGMSGTGKSTLIRELAARGYKAIDADDPGLSEYRVVPRQPGEPADRSEWVWREDAIRGLLATEDGDALFLAGCAANQGRFYPRFDHIVLLTAPFPVLRERLATRTGNSYGKDPDELAEVLHNQQTVEPLLRHVATIELDTRAPLDDLIAAILALI
jgi:broad-specificity NMP kinase